MYAIVKTGGKQYRVSVGDVVSVEKLAALGWRATSSVADGVAETAAFCLAHRDVL